MTYCVPVPNPNSNLSVLSINCQTFYIFMYRKLFPKFQRINFNKTCCLKKLLCPLLCFGILKSNIAVSCNARQTPLQSVYPLQSVSDNQEITLSGYLEAALDVISLLVPLSSRLKAKSKAKDKAKQRTKQSKGEGKKFKKLF